MNRIKNILESIGLIIPGISGLAGVIYFYKDKILNLLDDYYTDSFLLITFLLGLFFIVHFRVKLINVFSGIQFKFSKIVLVLITSTVFLLSIYQTYYYIQGFKLKSKLLTQVRVIKADNYFKNGDYEQSIFTLKKHMDNNPIYKEYINDIEKVIKLKHISLELYKFLPLYSYKKMEALNILYKLTTRKDSDINLSSLNINNQKLPLISNFYFKYKNDIQKNDDTFKQVLIDIKNKRFIDAYKIITDLKKEYPNNSIYTIFYKEIRDIVKKNKSIYKTSYVKEVFFTNKITDLVKKYKFNNDCQ